MSSLSNYVRVVVKTPEALMSVFNALVVCDVEFEYTIYDPAFPNAGYGITAYCTRQDFLDIVRSELENQDLMQIFTANNGKKKRI